jgi:hypothetical protein
VPADHGFRPNQNESASPMRPEASEGDPESSIEWREARPRMPVDVDGELLAEGQLHDGLVLAAPEEGEGAAQHAGDEGDQRPKHRLILAAAGVEWESESRVEASLSSTDQGNRGPGKPEQHHGGRISGTHKVCDGVTKLKAALDRLERVNAPLRPASQREHARLMRDEVLPDQNAVRAAADRLEKLMPDDLWPLPTYRDLLFIK